MEMHRTQNRQNKLKKKNIAVLHTFPLQNSQHSCGNGECGPGPSAAIQADETATRAQKQTLAFMSTDFQQGCPDKSNGAAPIG